MMKIFLLGISIIFLASCAYNSKNLIHIKGDEVSYPMGISTIKGKNVDITIYREMQTGGLNNAYIGNVEK